MPPSPVPRVGPAASATRAVAATLAVFAVIGAVGSATYLSGFLVYGPGVLPAVELFHAPLVQTAQWLMFVGLGGIGMLLPAMVGQRLPLWAVCVTAGSFIASAAMSFAVGSVLAEATRLVSDAEFQAFTDYPLNLMIGFIHGVLGLVGFVALAIIGRRRKVFGWGTTVLFVLAALTACLWHVPPGGLVGSLAVLALVRALRPDWANGGARSSMRDPAAR